VKIKPDKRPATIAPRLRSQGYWAILIGFIGLVGCLIGTVQLWIYGVVSIRPGHEPASGDSAVQMLFVLGLVGVFFAAYGAFQVYRAHRMSMR
jgi:hypothetical protein